MRSQARSEQRGYALVVALLVISLLVAGGALMMQELVVRSNLLRAETSELHLQSVLDSAVAQMMATYRYDIFFTGSDQLKIDGGEAKMEAEVLGLTLRRVTIEANYHGLERKIEVSFYVASAEPIRLLDWKPIFAFEAAP